MLQLINIEKIKEGDREVFQQFFEEIYPRMMSLACRFVDDEDDDVAKDMVQEAFTSLWEQKEILKVSNILSYLYKSVQNNCLNYIKHNKVVANYESRMRIAEARIQYLNEMSDENDILRELEHKDIQAALQSALNKLPPKCKEAFMLCYFEELNYKEIAQVMNISHRTVEVHVQKALKQLKKDFHFISLLLILVLHNTDHFFHY
ncbi:MAG: RNA polymerase sigma-70 factor [Prevotella sp.]|jgi:RNA polymerase sigma-70 factor (ECF subfamily)|nr:RNA polymerase sigma-70 factor [Prevotella sp.]